MGDQAFDLVLMRPSRGVLMALSCGGDHGQGVDEHVPCKATVKPRSFSMEGFSALRFNLGRCREHPSLLPNSPTGHEVTGRNYVDRANYEPIYSLSVPARRSLAR